MKKGQATPEENPFKKTFFKSSGGIKEQLEQAEKNFGTLEELEIEENKILEEFKSGKRKKWDEEFIQKKTSWSILLLAWFFKDKALEKKAVFKVTQKIINLPVGFLIKKRNHMLIMEK